MRLDFRRGSAVQLLLAVAGAVFLALPAFAACPPAGPTTVTTAATNTFTGSANVVIDEPAPSTIRLLSPASTTTNAIDLSITRTAPGNGVYVIGRDRGPISDVCYDGAAGATMTGTESGMYADTDGDGDTVFNIAHDIDVSSTAVQVYKRGSGDIVINTSGNLSANWGIWLEHKGAAGNISITTAAGTTVVGSTLNGGAGIQVERHPAGAARVDIVNNASVSGHIGISYGYCVCGFFETGMPVTVVNNGAITANGRAGMYIRQSANGTLDIANNGAITSAGIGIEAVHVMDTGDLTVVANGTIKSFGDGINVVRRNLEADARVILNGHIESNGGHGVRVVSDRNTFVDVNGSIRSFRMGVDAITEDGNSVVTTSAGSVIEAFGADASTAFWYVAGAASLPYYFLGGSGINAESVKAGEVLVDNKGSITSFNGMGIGAHAYDGATARIVSTGTVSGYWLGAMARADYGTAIVDIEAGSVYGATLASAPPARMPASRSPGGQPPPASTPSPRRARASSSPAVSTAIWHPPMPAVQAARSAFAAVRPN